LRQRDFKIGCLIFFLLLSFVLRSQIDDLKTETTFVDYHKKANELPFYDTINLVEHGIPQDVDSVLLLLFRKSDWSVEELFVADSLVVFALNKLPPIQKGIICYNIAYAYRDFDGVVCDSLLRNAYAIFKEHKDVEGQIFSLSSLLENKFIERDDFVLEPHLSEGFKTLFQLKHQTAYINAQERILGNQFNYQLLQGKPLGEEFLDSVHMTLLEKGRLATPHTANVLAEIAIHHYGNQSLQKAIIAAKQALEVALLFRTHDDDTKHLVYLYNLGYLYAANQQFDTAQFFLHAARKLVPKPQSIYHIRLNSNVLYALANSYFHSSHLDSAYHYLNESLELTVKAAELAQQEKRSYADKKYEAAFYKTQLDQSLLTVQQQRAKQVFYLIILLALTVFGLIAFFLSRKRKKLMVEAQKLSSSREQLLQVISHDFSSNIRSLIAYVKIYKDAKDQLADTELETLEWNFIAAATALQNTLQNINYWATGFRQTKKPPTQEVQVNELLEELLASYRLTAKLKNLKFFSDFQSSTIQADATAFATLCRNVLNNAIKHALPDTMVQLAAKMEKKQLIITLSNKCLPKDKMALVDFVDCIAEGKVYLSQNGSLGMELIGKALRKLRGTMEMGNRNGAPDEVVVLIRIPVA